MRLLRFALLTALSFASVSLSAQKLIKNMETVLRIDNILEMQASPLHFYVLSESEGLVVFRNRPDSLQWLYTTEGMQDRGSELRTDVRFAYIFGDGTRLSVIEPTSILGTYTSTYLPSAPVGVARVREFVYSGLSSGGIVRLSITSPDAFDSEPEFVEWLSKDELVVDMISVDDNSLVVSTEAPALLILQLENDKLELVRRVATERPLYNIRLKDGKIYANGKNGGIYLVRDTGRLAPITNVGEPVDHFDYFGDVMLIRSEGGRVWTYSTTDSLQLMRGRSESGNHFLVSRNNLWMNEFEILQQLNFESTNIATEGEESTDKLVNLPRKLTISKLSDEVLPYPRALVKILNVNENWPAGMVQYFVRSQTAEAKIQSKGLYWQPSSRDIGSHIFTVVASSANGLSDSTSFEVNVKPFNSPPRFAPYRPITIPVNNAFELPISARDPDGSNPELIRYMGVDMPEGATIEEQTGLFKWKPELKHVGVHRFQIVGTDQYGAASAIELIVTVEEVVGDS